MGRGKSKSAPAPAPKQEAPAASGGQAEQQQQAANEQQQSTNSQNAETASGSGLGGTERSQPKKPEQITDVGPRNPEAVGKPVLNAAPRPRRRDRDPGTMAAAGTGMQSPAVITG